MKVFGIGWAKTGTTTLRVCFETLGYSHYAYDLSLVGDVNRALKIAEQYETFKDWPWILYYRELDQRFPGSKFILTTRDSESWIKSYRNATTDQGLSPDQLEARRIIYEAPYVGINDEELIARVNRHNADVKAYFAKRPEDLLVVNWAEGDGWSELCAFLGRDVPSVPFPHANKGNYS